MTQRFPVNLINAVLRRLRGRVPAGGGGPFYPPGPDTDGPPGVREPRRPRPGAPSTAAHAPEPPPPQVAHDRMEPPPEELSVPPG